MKITVDTGICIGAGQCMVSAGTVFDQDEETGLVILLDESPADDLLPQVREAAQVCPAQAISVDEHA
jgi:ferredoxin